MSELVIFVWVREFVVEVDIFPGYSFKRCHILRIDFIVVSYIFIIFIKIEFVYVFIL